MSPRLLVLLLPLCGLFAQDDAAAVARRIADMQLALPWFFAPPWEGLADLPYTYAIKETRVVTDRSGKPHTLTLDMERVPLAGGSYYRCVAQNGKSPCAAEIVDAFERDSHWAETAGDAQKAKAKAAREDRLRRRTAFWTEFPAAFAFERVGSTQLRFRPNRKYRARSDAARLLRIEGDLWFDPQSFAITRIEYRSEDVGAIAVVLADLADHHYLPVSATERRAPAKGKTETSTMEFARYQRFTTDSSVQFLERDK
jgi:hypothetical protein